MTEQARVVKERPILFNGEMVQALLDGRKTQTRRVLKVQPLDVLPMNGDKAGKAWVSLMQREPEPQGGIFRCRYGVPGDRLWVRETFSYITLTGLTDPWAARAIATGRYKEDPEGNARYMCYAADGDTIGSTWKPSIHMFRWQSRISLELTGVRVERVQDISEEDAEAEGVTLVSQEPGMHDYLSYIEAYAHLWDKLNKSRGYGWDINPWVWVLEFKRL